MGTSPTEPFRFSLKLFIFNIQKTKLNMPKGSGLTKPMKLSAELADIVGKKEASRAECIKQLWAYIKKNNLQDPENKQFFNPDKKMAKVIFQTHFFNFSPSLLADLRQRQDPCLRHGQVLERTPLISVSTNLPIFLIPHKNLSPPKSFIPHNSSLNYSRCDASRRISCSFAPSLEEAGLRGADTQPNRRRRPQLTKHRTLPRLTNEIAVR